MINTVLNIVKMVAAILPFIALCILGQKVNLPKSERSRQLWMPVVALIYVIAAMILADNICDWLIKLINNIPVWLNSLAAFSWMPEKISDIIIMIASFINRFIKSINLNFWIFFIANTAIITAYLVVKDIALGIMRKAVRTDSTVYTKIAGAFYEYFPEKGMWCLKENYAQTRGLLKVFYYSALIISALLMLVSRKFYYEGLLKSLFYPVFGIIVVGELFFYLDGATKGEYTGDILGEDEDAYKTVNYSLLRKFLRSIFGDKLLTENTSVNNALAYDVTTDEIIRELEKSEDPKTVSFATYFKALNKTGFSIDHNYLYSSLDLLNGKSILFNNPFYNDLIPYAFYPMNRALLAHKKVLVVLGRHSVEEDITAWIEKGVQSVTNIPFMWKIGVLGEQPEELDIGIITRSAVLDIELHHKNCEFLEKVGFVIVIEPSKLISTAQIGLNLIVKQCKAEADNEITYCLCDKNCDGLVDAMSHILMTGITEVSATNKHLGTSSYMCWETDDEYLHHRLIPNISRYLGVGTELSFAALKNQVSKTRWYGGEAFPVTDIRWIGRQYYYDLTRYAGLPTSQEAMDEHFETSPNLWSASAEKNSYITVEDEAFNMFEVLRDFSTRTTEQGFINVISQDYLLKDYMAENASIFETDAKAIPYIVADYTRSHRNTALRLMLMMSTVRVSAETLEKELSLLGVRIFDLKKQLWFEIYNCYASLQEISELQGSYTERVDAASFKTIRLENEEFGSDVIKVAESFNMKKGKIEIVYFIDNKDFKAAYVSKLKSAGYVAEDEKGERYYLGAELSGHIYQKYLPGQFFTLGGKYYEMQYLTADGQILVRRAADHINNRPAYRQERVYTVHSVRDSDKIGAQQDVAGLKVVKQFADITVETPGYYRMERYSDFATAKKVSFSSDSGIPCRTYRNKEILRIDLPELDGKLNDNIRYTVTLLFNEIFRTLFAENQAFICAVTEDIDLPEGVNPLTYSIKGEGCSNGTNSIYIIEDSQLDLGLTVAVERNLERIFKIIHDYLNWHSITLENSLNPPSEPIPPIIFTDTEEEENSKKKGIFSKIGRGIKKIFEKIKGWFKKKPKEETPTEGDEPVDGELPPQEPEKPEEENTTPETEGEQPEEETTPTEDTEQEKEAPAEDEKEPKGIFGWLKRKKRKNPEKPEEPEATEEQPEAEAEEPAKTAEEAEPQAEAPTDPEPEETDAEGVAKEAAEVTEMPFRNEIVSPAENTADTKAGFSVERKPYHERYYTLFGADEEPTQLDLRGTLEYLSAMGMDRNALKQARENKNVAEMVEATFKPGKPDSRYCDFCGCEIYGVEYETLADGRDRCMACSRTAIKTGEEFRKIFEDVKRNMEAFFGIRINVGIKVQMVNSKTLHKRLGQAFVPTPKSDGRVLGVAISDKNGYTLLVENGSPRMASMLTMAHELTHIWQYINWDDRAIRRKYGRKMRLEIYEGMAKWVEIQYAYLINEPATAKREEIITAYRDDEYGRGFLRYRANYPFSLGTVITKPTPFLDRETPLKPEYCGAFTVIMPKDPNALTPEDGDNNSGNGGATPAEPIKGPVNRTPGKVNMYAYGLLSGEEKRFYDAALQAVNDFVPELAVTDITITDTQVNKIIDFVQRDHPEIFWFQHGATYYFDTVTHIVNRVEFEYCMPRAEAEKRQKKLDTAVKAFMSGITSSMSDYEATLHIYENIIRLVDYDTVGLERQNGNISSDIPDDLRSIYGVFVNKKAVCAGYAKATQYLLNLCGIECTYVTSDTHAWNMVKLEGDYYHLDTTWGDGTDTKKEKAQSEAISYDCFCITTAELSRLDAHTPVSEFPLPVCTATKCNYHRRHGLFFEKYDFNKIRSVVCRSVDFERFDVSFKFADEKVFSEAKTALIDNAKFREIIQFSNLKSNHRVGNAYMYSSSNEKLTIALHLTKL
ncbi:MAG: hypothetical protein IKD04_09740 [Clostridia bacterium]|nr:hypothetical protein [Clostridia bacterium]